MKEGWERPSLWPTPPALSGNEVQGLAPTKGTWVPLAVVTVASPRQGRARGQAQPGGGWGARHPTRGRLWESVG